MKNKTKVSVIMPIYNAEKFLKQSLESVLNQTLKEIEIVCVNDGSTDGSLGIIKAYAKKDKRIKIIDKQNTGYGDSMNVGVQNATGEYIGIVEPDDYVDLKMFEELHTYAKNKNADIVKSNHYEFDENVQRFIQIVPRIKMFGKVLNKNNKKIFQAVMNTWTGIYRREFLIENNIWHNTSPGASFQDTGFWFQTIAMAERVVFLNKTFYYHRIDNPNSSINNTQKIYCVCDEFKFIEKKLKEKNLFEKLEQVFFLEKYNCYIFSFFRIGKEYKRKFLFDIMKEFKNVNLDFAKEYFEKNKFIELKKFLTETENFYEEYKDKNYLDFLKAILRLEGKNKFTRTISRIKKYGLRNSLIITGRFNRKTNS